MNNAINNNSINESYFKKILTVQNLILNYWHDVTRNNIIKHNRCSESKYLQAKIIVENQSDKWVGLQTNILKFFIYVQY